MSSNWIRVASGLNLVASSVIKEASKNGSYAITHFAVRHGPDFSNNMKIAANAAFMQHGKEMNGVNGLKDIKSSDVLSDVNGISNLNGFSDELQEQTNENQNITLETDVSKDKEEMKNINCDLKSDSIPTKESNEMENIEISNNEPRTNNETIPQMTENDYNNQNETIENKHEKLVLGQPVPATRIKRVAGFASLALGLAAGTVSELTTRLLSSTPNNTSIVVNDANADRLAATLCRMRGAALKLGQMLSIQDETLLPTPLTRALSQVRTGAYAMPLDQLYEQLIKQLGNDWNSKIKHFQEVPIAAASIGQVHRANVDGKDVIMKVQYPGVANSIESDLANLQMLVKVTGLAPPGLYIDEIIRVGRQELKVGKC